MRDDLTKLICCSRAYVTTKEDAFARPVAFTSSEGSNDSTPNEDVLIQAYLELGRADLADCVRGGRLYHRLEDMLTAPTWKRYKLLLPLITETPVISKARRNG